MLTRTVYTLLLLLVLTNAGKSQPRDSITSINNFFAGIPVKEGFKKWVEYLYNQPSMGLDSANSKGSYSSLKSGMKDHFPFPDSVQVKILAGNLLRKIPGIDTMFVEHALLIEGIFGNNKASGKNAAKYFDQLNKLLKKYYKVRNSDTKRVYFSKGVNKNFPPLTLQIDYSEELQFHFIVLSFEEE